MQEASREKEEIINAKVWTAVTSVCNGGTVRMNVRG